MKREKTTILGSNTPLHGVEDYKGVITVDLLSVLSRAAPRSRLALRVGYPNMMLQGDKSRSGYSLGA